MRATVLAVLTAAAVVAAPLPATAAPPPDDAELAADLAEQVILERTARGAPPLGSSPELQQRARQWSAHMADTGELAGDPDLRHHTQQWDRLGEVVGAFDLDDATLSDAVEALWSSSEHRDTLMGEWDELAVGVNEDEGRVWVTVLLREHAAREVAEIGRVAGEDRADTAAQLARRHHSTSDTALVARHDDYADALAGASLSGELDAPLLLTRADSLPASTRDAVRDLEVERVLVLGGAAAVGPSVVEELGQLGVAVERVGGSNRFETAAAVADHVDADRALLVEGTHPDPDRGWPDAVAVSALSAATGTPVLLATRDDVPPATRAALAQVDDVVVVGGEAALSADVERDAAALSGAAVRVAGGDRFATSAQVARYAGQQGVDSEQVVVATGRDWPDALTAGAAAGGGGSQLLLVDGDADRLDDTAAAWLGARAAEVETLTVAGGPGAVSSDVAGALSSLLGR